MELESKHIELSTDTRVLSLPESWKPEAIEGRVRVDSADGIFSIYVSTYNVDTLLSGWAQRYLEIVKNSKHSNPENDSKYMQETIDLDSNIQSFVLDAYDKKSSFRIYTQHFIAEAKGYSPEAFSQLLLDSRVVKRVHECSWSDFEKYHGSSAVEIEKLHLNLPISPLFESTESLRKYIENYT